MNRGRRKELIIHPSSSPLSQALGQTQGMPKNKTNSFSRISLSGGQTSLQANALQCNDKPNNERTGISKNVAGLDFKWLHFIAVISFKTVSNPMRWDSSSPIQVKKMKRGGHQKACHLLKISHSLPSNLGLLFFLLTILSGHTFLRNPCQRHLSWAQPTVLSSVLFCDHPCPRLLALPVPQKHLA